MRGSLYYSLLIVMLTLLGCGLAASEPSQRVKLVFLHFHEVPVTLNANGVVLLEETLLDEDPTTGLNHIEEVELRGSVEFVLRHGKAEYRKTVEVNNDVFVIYIDASENPFLVQKDTAELLLD